MTRKQCPLSGSSFLFSLRMRGSVFLLYCQQHLRFLCDFTEPETESTCSTSFCQVNAESRFFCFVVCILTHKTQSTVPQTCSDTRWGCVVEGYGYGEA